MHIQLHPPNIHISKESSTSVTSSKIQIISRNLLSIHIRRGYIHIVVYVHYETAFTTANNSWKVQTCWALFVFLISGKVITNIGRGLYAHEIAMAKIARR